jgi:hypothetical protein
MGSGRARLGIIATIIQVAILLLPEVARQCSCFMGSPKVSSGGGGGSLRRFRHRRELAVRPYSMESEIWEIPLSELRNGGAGAVRLFVEAQAQEKGKDLVRWNISEIDEEANLIRAAVVYTLGSPQLGSDSSEESSAQQGYFSRRSAIRHMSAIFVLAVFGGVRHVHAADEGEDFLNPVSPLQSLGSIVRKGVQQYNDALVEGTARINTEAYVASKRLQGKSDDVFGRLPPPPQIEGTFATRALEIPNRVFAEQMGIGIEEVCRQVAAAEARYRSYFEGQQKLLVDKVQDPATFNFKCYAQYKVFASGLQTATQVKSFNREIGARLLANLALPLRKYDARKEGLFQALEGCSRILSDLKDSKKFITGFQVIYENIDEVSYTKADGFSTCSFTIIVDQVGGLAVMVQLDYEGQKRLLPSTVPELLSAYLRECNVARPQYELYYLDDRYRPASDYSPTQLLISFTLD